jgi:cyclophilin family peptidyl-prolyl cis-trans isomerase
MEELMRRLLVLVLGMGLAGMIACSKDQKAGGADCTPLSDQEMQVMVEKVKSMPMEPVKENQVAVFETNYGEMVIDLFTDKAPQHTAAFKRLVNAGYYDCTKFHRVINDFMIQGGDLATRDENPENDGGGSGPGYTLEAEFNDVEHEEGVLSMARGRDPNSAGSQFFICLTREKCKHLDGQYTAFGRVVEGLDVLRKIGNVDTKVSPVYQAPVLPSEPVVITDAYMQTR